VTPTVVPTEAGVRVTAVAPLVHLCPHVEEVDYGKAHISWATAGQTIELHSLRAWLQSFSNVVVSHEQITDLIKDELEGLDGITDVRVQTSWITAGMEVGCSTSATPPGEPS